ncbi:hypothetical protein [Pseudalkalibacillus sp. SCS-8]|uniref:hypothetical protein n=1 Tax=Pseudalkalibacillus nanhaiensis TaxID=3115291 RepID=UPI0032DB203C
MDSLMTLSLLVAVGSFFFRKKNEKAKKVFKWSGIAFLVFFFINSAFFTDYEKLEAEQEKKEQAKIQAEEEKKAEEERKKKAKKKKLEQDKDEVKKFGGKTKELLADEELVTDVKVSSKLTKNLDGEYEVDVDLDVSEEMWSDMSKSKKDSKVRVIEKKILEINDKNYDISLTFYSNEIEDVVAEKEYVEEDGEIADDVEDIVMDGAELKWVIWR